MNLIGTKNLETTRLNLRKINISDASDMFNNWACDEDVARYVTWQAHTDINVTKSLIDIWVSKQNNNDNFAWCLELKENKKVIGTIDVVGIDAKIERAEIGYCMSKAYWNKGIMTEALTAVIDFLFSEVDFNRIVAKHHINNPASGKVMMKSGMQFEGVERQGAKDNKGDFCDIAVLAILKSDWLKNNNRR